jgi:hypothetical protein
VQPFGLKLRVEGGSFPPHTEAAYRPIAFQLGARHAGVCSAVLATVKGRSSPCSPFGLRVVPVPAAPLLTSAALLAHARGVGETKEWTLVLIERGIEDETTT